MYPISILKVSSEPATLMYSTVNLVRGVACVDGYLGFVVSLSVKQVFQSLVDFLSDLSPVVSACVSVVKVQVYG